jgi:hypothetical protein
MEEHRPDDFSSNGSYPEAAIGIAEPAEGETAATDGEAISPDATVEAATADEATGGESGPVESADTDAVTAPDDGTAFLAELAQAMQAAAGKERARIDEDADRRRAAHLETIQARRDSEAARMRELAAEDLKGIDEWAEGERQRIDQEREQRAAALQEDLDTSLAEHGAMIETEIQGVEAAVTAYRTEVEAFFAKLDAEKDPVEIARLAAQRPAFPDLAAASAAQSAATPAAGGEQAPVGVMDAETAADPATAWSRWNATTAAAEVPETVPAVPAGAGSTLLGSVPVTRPYAGLIGDSEDR